MTRLGVAPTVGVGPQKSARARKNRRKNRSIGPRLRGRA
eukprot:gene43863-53633_t